MDGCFLVWPCILSQPSLMIKSPDVLCPLFILRARQKYQLLVREEVIYIARHVRNNAVVETQISRNNIVIIITECHSLFMVENSISISMCNTLSTCLCIKIKT